MGQDEAQVGALPSAARPAARHGGILRGIVQVAGELLITAGVILLLFIAWQLWWTNVESDARQNEVIKEFAQELDGRLPPINGGDGQNGGGTDPGSGGGGTPVDYGEPVVSPAPLEAGTIGLVYIPRFGPNYTRPVVEGTSQPVLDTLGLGHYSTTSMPGAVGNFAVAGHRQTHGAVLDNIHTLVPGDRIYIQTRDGFYIYVFRNTEIVLPSRIDVLLPVPTQPGVTPSESIFTMTSCNPRFGDQERIIAYSVLESWQPLSAGVPREIARQVSTALGMG